MSKVLSARVSDEFAEWFEGYAKHRGLSKQDLQVAALESFREDAALGVPEVKSARADQVQMAHARNVGVGACPKRLPGLGHIWAGVKASGDDSNPCVFCGTSGREFFKAATAQRTNVFDRLKVPMESGTGDPRKAYPKGMPPAQAAWAAAIVADKKRRDQAK